MGGVGVGDSDLMSGLMVGGDMGMNGDDIFGDLVDNGMGDVLY